MSARAPEGGRQGGGGRSLVAAFFICWILLQFAVPVMQLFDARPARFGWQMYSAVSVPPLFLVERSSVIPDTVDVRRYAITLRGEIDWDAIFPAHLCTAVPEVRAVLVVSPDRSGSRRVPCP